MQLEKKIGHILTLQGKTLSAAESCTGGLLSHTLTNIPGSSKFFYLGIVAYDNRAKQKLLKIPALTLKTYGAVSAPVCRLMAQNVRKILKTDLGVGITGIAGPAGSSKLKPVGLVYIAVSDNKETLCKEFHFTGSRLAIKTKTLKASLALLVGFL